MTLVITRDRYPQGTERGSQSDVLASEISCVFKVRL
jgi:hypothetical protein